MALNVSISTDEIEPIPKVSSQRQTVIVLPNISSVTTGTANVDGISLGQRARSTTRRRRCWVRGRARSLNSAAWSFETRPSVFSMESLHSDDDSLSSRLSFGSTQQTIDEDAEKIVQELKLLRDRSRFDHIGPPQQEIEVIDRPTIKNFKARLRHIFTFGCFRGKELVRY